MPFLSRERIAQAMLAAAAAALLASVFFPYWKLKITAPQYPKGLKVAIYLQGAKGDVAEIDILNHYIGMRSLAKAAALERKLALPGIALTVLGMALAAAFMRRRKWVLLLVFPAIVFPGFFAADLYYWMRDFGLHLDPHAPLSSSIKPFVPPLLGAGKIAQFHAHADFAFGHGLSMLAAILCATAAALVLFGRKSKALVGGAGAAGKAACLAGWTTFICVLGMAAGAAAENTIVVTPSSPRALQDAVERARDGDTLRVKPGVYAGPVTAKKTLRLIGEDYPVIDGGGKGTVLRLSGPATVFRGFVVRGSGDLLSPEDTGLVVSGKDSVVQDNRFEDVLFGVYVQQASGTVLRNNSFYGKELELARRGDLIRTWYSNGVCIEGNRTYGGRDAVLWFSRDMTVRGNDFQGGRYGLHFMYCKDALVEDNRMTGNSVGVYLMYSAGLTLKDNRISENRGPSGFGIGFKDMEGAVIEGNFVSSNRVGLFLENASRTLCRNNTIAANDIGAQVSPSSRQNRFEGNNFMDNAEQVIQDSQSAFTVNDWTQNHWSDYAGYDADGDGIGDIAYSPVRLFERITDRAHAFKIFLNSPAMRAIDYAAATFPIFMPESKFTDQRPLMQPVPMRADAGTPSAPAAWALFSGTLLLPLLGFLKWGGPAIKVCAEEAKAEAARDAGRPLLRIKGLTKRFGDVRVLDGMDLEIRQGEVVALWGPNGAGKTTLLRCLLGLLPFQGEARVMDLDVQSQGKEARRYIGYVPQEIRLHADQSVWETVSFFARLRGVSLARARGLLAEWGLQEGGVRDRHVQYLSGGMKQKLALVLALLSDPPVLFLDEPMSNLDLAARREFGRSLERLKAAGKTLLFCSHRHSEVRKIADRVIVLEAGRHTEIAGTPGAGPEALP